MAEPGKLDPKQDYVRDDRSLEDPLESDPAPLVRRWIEEAVAGRVQVNPTAMSVATADLDGRPSLRMVICRGYDLEQGWFVFYTDRTSRKGRELGTRPLAAAMFHWDALGRSVRIEGPVGLSPESESDAYFHGRPREAQIAAWSSDQSEPIASRAELLARLGRTTDRFGPRDTDPTIPRPERWGGYRIWAERIEAWVGRPGRVHDRALWSRTLQPEGDGWKGSPWSVTRLQP